jgi:hypothetical protein
MLKPISFLAALAFGAVTVPQLHTGTGTYTCLPKPPFWPSFIIRSYRIPPQQRSRGVWFHHRARFHCAASLPAVVQHFTLRSNRGSRLYVSTQLAEKTTDIFLS